MEIDLTSLDQPYDVKIFIKPNNGRMYSASPLTGYTVFIYVCNLSKFNSIREFVLAIISEVEQYRTTQDRQPESIQEGTLFLLRFPLIYELDQIEKLFTTNLSSENGFKLSITSPGQSF